MGSNRGGFDLEQFGVPVTRFQVAQHGAGRVAHVSGMASRQSPQQPAVHGAHGQFAGLIWSLKEPWLEPQKLHFNKGGVVFCKRTPALCEIGDTLDELFSRGSTTLDRD